MPLSTPPNLQALSFDLASLRAAYAAGTPVRAVIAEAMRRCASDENHAFIHRLTDAEIEPYVARLESADGVDPASLPLYGVPFAIKDNIDLAHIPTTAGCPEYAYTPGESAFLVQQLIAAGAVPLGKANLDQFATGLNGTRSPYGACRNAFNPEFVSGGSSSGSAVSVAKGWVSFSLGTDTAGSGRVPASFNNLIGLKPTIGLLGHRRGAGLPLGRHRVHLRAHRRRRPGRAGRGRGARKPTPSAAPPNPSVWTSRPAPSASACRARKTSTSSATTPPSNCSPGIARLHALGGTAVEIDLTPFSKPRACSTKALGGRALRRDQGLHRCPTRGRVPARAHHH
ncbi:MAG: amidase family protein [Burkholderiaceae bacterium]